MPAVNKGFKLGDQLANARDLLPCWPKVQHADREMAVAHLRSQAAMSTRGADERLNAFECPHCHAWHVGHSKNNLTEDGSMRKSYYDEVLKRDVELDDVTICHDNDEFRKPAKLGLKEASMHPTFNDFLNDTPLVKRARARMAKATAESLTAPMGPSKTATDEFEHLLALRINAHPAETRAVATDEVFRANPGLYDRYRRENTVGRDGQVLDRNPSAHNEGRGRVTAKSAELVETEVARRVEALVAKTSGATTQQAMTFLFRSDPALYDRWRRGAYAEMM